jgi:hypothetical protein
MDAWRLRSAETDLSLHEAWRSGEELEGPDVPRPHLREVPPVERGDTRDAESFGHGDDAGIHGPEWEVAVTID